MVGLIETAPTGFATEATAMAVGTETATCAISAATRARPHADRAETRPMTIVVVVIAMTATRDATVRATETL